MASCSVLASSTSQRMAVPRAAAPQMRASPSPSCSDAPVLFGCPGGPAALPCKLTTASARVGAISVNVAGGFSSIALLPARRSRLRSAGDGAVAVEEEVAGAAQKVVPIEKRYPAFPSILDINAIRDILPHRFPFLLVDRIIEYNPGVTAVGIKNVTINDNFFPGHFPERPIMPGVLMVEAMAQVGGILLLSPDIGGSKESFFFAGVDKVRFRKPVIAGDTLVMRMNLIKLQKRFGIAKLEGKAYVGGEVVCEGEFLMAMGSSD